MACWVGSVMLIVCYIFGGLLLARLLVLALCCVFRAALNSDPALAAEVGAAIGEWEEGGNDT